MPGFNFDAKGLDYVSGRCPCEGQRRRTTLHPADWLPWDRGAGIMFDPDRRYQEVIGAILTRCQELGSAGQVLSSMADQGIHFCKTRSNTGPQKRLRFAVVAE